MERRKLGSLKVYKFRKEVMQTAKELEDPDVLAVLKEYLELVDVIAPYLDPDAFAQLPPEGQKLVKESLPILLKGQRVIRQYLNQRSE